MEAGFNQNRRTVGDWKDAGGGVLIRRMDEGGGGAHPGAKKGGVLLGVVARSSMLKKMPSRVKGQDAGEKKVDKGKKNSGVP